MRKLAGITIISFAALAVAGTAGTSPIDVGLSVDGADARIVVEKELPDDYDGELPSAWAFRIGSINCGPAIIPPGGGAPVASIVVDVEAEGGDSDTVGVFTAFGGPGVVSECQYSIVEVAVDGWEPVSPIDGVTQVTPVFGETLRVPFVNRPVPPPPETPTTVPETTTTAPETTTTEPESTTTEPADTTTTVADTTTTLAAPTTVPPTTAGTVAPELPATGSSNALTGLLAGLLVLGGLGAVMASRRT